MSARSSGLVTALLVLLSIGFSQTAIGKELHVSPAGDDAADGSAARSLKTISAAARLAMPGDLVTVHAGVYRERIDPPRGGESEDRRITYQAAAGEAVEITGAEPFDHWDFVSGDVWKAIVPNTPFGSFNPFSDVLHGDWFKPQKGRVCHTGAVYLNGDWLEEAATLEEVMKGGDRPANWFANVDAQNTVIFARFPKVDPNTQRTEMNVRQSVFYPTKTGMNYITVRGFVLRNAATPWAPPTAEQIGLIGTNWSKGWLIEKNRISYSICSGVSLGKHGDEWDNRSASSAGGYVKTVERALARGWSKENIGHHVVRDNTISHCEQAGIVGSLGGAFSRIIGNDVHDIHVRRSFGGAEMAAIKLHAAIDVEIRGNRLHHSCRGLWLDWMAQGTRVTGNLLHDNATDQDLTVAAISGGRQDMFVEVNHGPFVVDNNIFLSPLSVQVRSQGTIYAHNLFAGAWDIVALDKRVTPFHKPHSTEIAGMHDNPSGDVRFYNNVFARGGDLTRYDAATLPVAMAGNVFLGGAKPAVLEKEAAVSAVDPEIKLVEKEDGVYLEFTIDAPLLADRNRPLVTTELAGKAVVANLPFENFDGSPLRIAADYLGQARNESNPSPGPFELKAAGRQSMKVWPPPPEMK